MTQDFLTPEQRRIISALPCDVELYQHECWRWEDLLKDPPSACFLLADGHPILIPVAEKHLPNITLLRFLRDGDSLMVFIRDNTYVPGPDEGGFLIFCQRYPGADFFVTTLYHSFCLATPPPFAPF